ncbi:B2 protein-like [Sitophilus oryzae]|uniref:B2 protein-like n=1 Tax=Sitophilus oryzae TaxID=7048 RepID=A0A6J2YLF7_SITOR|nr:B2 protein-like [Sitophilus oryzae]
MKLISASFLLVIGFTLIQAQGEIRDEILTHSTHCVGETGADLALVEQARRGVFQDDPNLRSFAFCMSRRLGFQNEAGEIQRELIRERLASLLSADIADQLVKACLIEKATPEETAAAAYRCYYETAPTRVVIF